MPSALYANAPVLRGSFVLFARLRPESDCGCVVLSRLCSFSDFRPFLVYCVPSFRELLLFVPPLLAAAEMPAYLFVRSLLLRVYISNVLA